MIVADQALLSEDLPQGKPIGISDVDEVAKAMDNIGGVDRTTRVLVVPTPEFQFEPGAEVRCSGLSGTLGACVTSSGGKRGILTAGHAAPGGVARDSKATRAPCSSPRTQREFPRPR